MGSPIKVVVAQDFAPQEPASVAGVILGTSTAIGALIYIGLGQVQALAGLTTGMAMGFALVLPAAAIAFTVFKRHPEVAK